MNKFLTTCRRCLNPKVLILIGLVVAGLIIFVPIVGVVSLIAALPLLGCALMCGGMAFFIRGEKHDK